MEPYDSIIKGHIKTTTGVLEITANGDTFAIKGWYYLPGKPARITSSYRYEMTGDPGDPEENCELEVEHVFVPVETEAGDVLWAELDAEASDRMVHAYGEYILSAIREDGRFDTWRAK